MLDWVTGRGRTNRIGMALVASTVILVAACVLILLDILKARRQRRSDLR